jgi:hypothetical protein
MAREASLRQYNGADSNIASLVLTQRFISPSIGIADRPSGKVPIVPAIYVVCSRIGLNTVHTSASLSQQQIKLIQKKETLQVILQVSPIR